MKIKEIVGLDNKGSYGLVHVVLEDGTEATVYVGGQVETFFHKGAIKAFVMRRPNPWNNRG